MRFKIDAKTDMVKSSDLLLFTTLWNDFDLSKVMNNRRKIEQEKQLIIFLTPYRLLYDFGAQFGTRFEHSWCNFHV